MMKSDGTSSSSSKSNEIKNLPLLIGLIVAIIVIIVLVLFLVINSDDKDLKQSVPPLVDPLEKIDLLPFLTALQKDVNNAPVLRLGEIFVDENTAMSYGKEGASDGQHVYSLSADEATKNVPFGFEPWGIFTTSLPISYDELDGIQYHMYLVGEGGHVGEILERNLVFFSGLGVIQVNLPNGDNPEYIYFVSGSGDSVKWDLDDTFTYDMVKSFEKKVEARYAELPDIRYGSSLGDRIEEGKITYFDGTVVTMNSIEILIEKYGEDILPKITDVTLLSEKKEYRIGDTAKLILKTEPKVETILYFNAHHELENEIDYVLIDDDGLTIVDYVITSRHEPDSVVTVYVSIDNPYKHYVSVEELKKMNSDERSKYQSSSLTFRTSFLIVE